VRLVDLGNIVHASDSTGLVVVTQLDPIFVIFTLPQDNLPEITEAMRQGALTVFAYDQNNRIKLGEGRLALVHNQIDQGTGSLRLKAVIPAAASASVSRREMPFSSVCNRPVSAASGAVRSRFIVSLRVRFGRCTIAALTGGLAP
jgi:hypothetical protein